MEGKTVILSVLIMSLVMAQIQVDAEGCCPSVPARNIYEKCRLAGATKSLCAQLSQCKDMDGNCPPGYTNDILKNPRDAVNEYCKLGCASSVCGALITLKNYDASEITNGAVVECTKACSTLCTKGSINAIKTA